MRRFCESDHVIEPIAKTTKEELDCEEHFKQSYSRLSSGEYSMCLTKKGSLTDLLVYKLNRVTYGTKPASILAIRAMHQVAFDE